ncbi:MAG: PadR family transcriptional regulator [Chloroflexota bacterium]|nr:PadR family transcriptional regulator [Chloroflexota bacterium]
MARPKQGASGDPGLLLLVSLASGPKHGHAMMQDVEEFARVRLGPGTLYGAVERLERDGLIEPIESSDRRRPYRLTEAGERALRDRLEGVAGVIRVGQRRVGAPARTA